MKFEAWYLLLGALMLAIAFLDRHVKRLPITTTILYLGVGLALGPFGFGILKIDPLEHSDFLERATELGVIISLFTAGLKLGAPLGEKRWQMPIRLASVSMIITVALIATLAVLTLGLTWGAAILLGAILAPTDPVLASDVQLEHPGDRDRLRFGLTGEAGLNDGTAFPFVMLGLGMLGLHELGWRWPLIDLLWATTAGLAIGGALGWLVGKRIRKLRAEHAETFARDEFIALGLIAFSYGAALFVHAYGFLAVFAAGLAMRLTEERAKGDEDIVAGPAMAANEQLERIAEVGLVLILGGMLSSVYFTYDAIWFAAILFFLIRPAAVYIGTIGCKATPLQRTLLSWFGIRGIGSLYYLMFALQKGLPEKLALQIASLALSIVAISIVAHGLSVTPIMNLYERRKKRGR